MKRYTIEIQRCMEVEVDANSQDEAREIVIDNFSEYSWEFISDSTVHDPIKVVELDADSEKIENQSQQEKCGDSLTHQHRHGTHPEEGQVSKENDMATVDNTFSENSEVNNGI